MASANSTSHAAWSPGSGGAMERAVRKTGLRILGDTPWGRHFALFYETKEDLLEICVPYLKAGLESNECCVWVISDLLTEKEARAALREAVPGLNRHVADQRVEILQSPTWYFTGDTPDLQKVARDWAAKLDPVDNPADGDTRDRVAALP